MKRRQNIISQDPYICFSFEKSLRKYEPSPRKKIKVDNCGGLKEINVITDKSITKKQQIQQRDNLISRCDDNLKDEQHRMDLNQQKNQIESGEHVQENNVQVSINQNRLQDKNQSENYSDQLQNLKSQQRESSIFQTKKDERCNIDQPKDGIVSRNQSCMQDIVQQQKQIKQQHILLILEEHFKATQPSQPQIHISQAHSQSLIDQNKNNSSKFSIDSHKDRIQGGRFNINEYVSISRRTLEKILYKNRNRQKNQAVNKLLDSILKKRSYLSSEREQIAKKLQQYLQNV